MACTPEYQSRLTDFARGELGGPEADSLLAHVFECPECSRELDLLADLTRNLSRQSAGETGHDAVVIPSFRGRRNVLFSAAALVLIALGLWAFLLDGSHRGKGQLADLARIEPLPFVSGQLRSPDQDGRQRFLETMELYRQGDFQQAAERLQGLLGEDPGDDKLRIYLGICHLQLHEAEAAVETLEPAVSSADELVGERALWYLGMAHLLRSDGSAAYGAFQSLRQRDGHYRLNAEDMLAELERLGVP